MSLLFTTGTPSRTAPVDQAIALLRATIVGPVFERPGAVKDYLTLKYAGLQHEVFGVLWLDAQHRLKGEEVLFRGTLSQTSVYPREVVKQGLLCNAGAVILFHNHPSGCSEPSRADEMLTQTLKQALALVDIRVLDHLVVSVGGLSRWPKGALSEACRTLISTVIKQPARIAHLVRDRASLICQTLAPKLSLRCNANLGGQRLATSRRQE